MMIAQKHSIIHGNYKLGLSDGIKCRPSIPPKSFAYGCAYRAHTERPVLARLRCAVIAVASRLIWQKLTLERSTFHSIRSAQCFGGVLNRRPFLGEKRKTSARAECFSV